MLAQERYTYILDLLKNKRTIHASQLMKHFDVSSETVRRDLEYLEKEGLLQRVHGGAALVKMDTIQGFFNSRMSTNIESKKEIAKKATSYVTEGYSIALDCSTTSLIFAQELKNKFHSLTIVTNSNEILNTLTDMNTYRIICCGGIFNPDERACFGTQAIDSVKHLNLDIAFIGVGGISIREGLTENYFEGATMLKTFLNAAQQKIVLADHTKFDTVTLVKICEPCDVDVIITDSKIKQKTLEKYRSNGFEII